GSQRRVHRLDLRARREAGRRDGDGRRAGEGVAVVEAGGRRAGGDGDRERHRAAAAGRVEAAVGAGGGEADRDGGAHVGGVAEGILRLDGQDAGAGAGGDRLGGGDEGELG